MSWEEIGREMLRGYEKIVRETLKTHPFCIEITQYHLSRIERLSKNVKILYKDTVLVGRKWVKIYYACFPTKEEAEKVVEKL